MKIEIGESLIYSWLRHIKKCQIVQTNWKPSPKWANDEVDLEKIKMEIEREFQDTRFDIFHKNNSISQFLQQAEIDVVGISHGNGSVDRMYHFADIAFHESGINYGTKEETISRVLKKFIRSYFIYLTYFNDDSSGAFYFITPKMSISTLLNPIRENILKVIKVINKFELYPEFQLLVNDEFFKTVLIPTLNISSEIADSNELFLRSVQLLNLFEHKTYDQIPMPAKPIPFNNPTLPVKKIGEHVCEKLNYLVRNDLLDDKEINQLLDEKYSKKLFNSNFPLLRLKQSGRNDKKGHPRYYKEIWEINKREFFFCSQWYEKQRNQFDAWFIRISQDKINDM